MDDPDLDLPDPAEPATGGVFFFDAATAFGCDASAQCLMCLERARDETLSEKETWMRLWCGHWSHTACVSDWFAKNKSCPGCRNDVSVHLESARREFLIARAEYKNNLIIKRWADEMWRQTERRERKATALAKAMGLIKT